MTNTPAAKLVADLRTVLDKSGCTDVEKELALRGILGAAEPIDRLGTITPRTADDLVDFTKQLPEKPRLA